jgi:hypothetical protein
MSDLKTITYRPGAGEYAWTFGGAAPVMRLRAPCALELYTEDCFAGRVRSADDLVSRLNITGLSRIRGNLTAQGTMVGSSEPRSDLRTVIAAEGAAVDGDIDLRDLHATGGALRFRNAAVGGLSMPTAPSWPTLADIRSTCTRRWSRGLYGSARASGPTAHLLSYLMRARTASATSSSGMSLSR